MSVLRSSSMVFTENRANLRPVRTTSKSDLKAAAKNELLLRAKRLSLDSSSLRKTLQDKFEEKDPKPPPLVGTGVRRYRGTRGSFGGACPQEVDEKNEDSNSKRDLSNRESSPNGHSGNSASLVQIQEEETEAKQEEREQPTESEMAAELQEVEDEARAIWSSLEREDLDLEDDLDLDGQVPSEVDMAELCARGNVRAVRVMARRGADLRVRDEGGRSLLQMAVGGGDSKLVGALLAAGAPRHLADARRGRTALHAAALDNELVMIKLMLRDLEEDPWGSGPLLSVTDKEGRTPLHLAAARGHALAVRLLLGGGFSVTLRDRHGHTPMHAALGLSHGCCHAVLGLLLGAGGDLAIKEEQPDGGRDSCTRPPAWGEDGPGSLGSSAGGEGAVGGGGSSEAVQRWSGAELEQDSERLLHAASRLGCPACLHLLVEHGAPVNSRDPRGRTPLHLAGEGGQGAAVRALAKLGAQLDPLDSRGLTPLHAAISSNREGAVGALLQEGASPSIQDPIGRTYPEHALHCRSLGSLRALLRGGVQHVAEEGSTLLHVCAAHGNIAATQLLLDMGWDPSAPDGGGRTPLHAAIAQGHGDLATLLISEGADLLKGDHKGATPLHYAVRWGGSDALLRMLVKRGASHAARDRLGRTPLHYAASKFSIMSDLYILLGSGASLNPKDISGLTPLHLAARLGNESLVRILLERGADPLAKDMYNFTPYDHAKENAHCSIMKRLQDCISPPGAEKTSSRDQHEAAAKLEENESRETRDAVEGALLSELQERRNITNEGASTFDSFSTVQKRDVFKKKTQRGSVAW